MLRFFILVLATLTCASVALAQRANNRSRSELGVRAGCAYYIGDLNRSKHFYNSQLYAGGVYKFNIHSRLAFRATAGYGKLEAYDADSRSAFQLNRNLSFRTDFYEVTSGFEFNYKSFQTGHSKHWISPYLFIELGAFRMNPKANIDGEWIELQPLGTEGQGSALSKKEQYNRVQFCIPGGMGLKISIAKNTCLSLEYGFRKTFTDHMDDVGSIKYADREALAENNGPLVAELSNRSLDGNAFGVRGNPNTKDWYFVANASLSFRLGKPDRCFHH